EPHFHRYYQDRIWLVEFDRQKTLPFFSQTTSGSVMIERHLSESKEFFWGLKLQSLHSQSVEGHHIYSLIKVPTCAKLSSAENLADPEKGLATTIRLTPSWQSFHPQFFYLNHTTSLIAYYPILRHKFTLAVKGTLGNIIGASEHTIPMPDRFFAGSENNLRGYRYLSVAPLNKNHKPIGGRSLLTGSLEARLRTESGLGWVLFYDVGRVYSSNFPNLDLKFLQSVGIGVRYSTPIGPLRLDIGLPLHRRKKIDSPFQIYFSIGQAF
ncbi:MAG TPA: BamA/TamA family outer membrane protein, partial [Chlamydiales bacterium]|nr:BamA/TamA family outer membrane protein [Chlamydiales bacterium]